MHTRSTLHCAIRQSSVAIFSVTILVATLLGQEPKSDLQPPMPSAERAAMLKHYRELEKRLTEQIGEDSSAVGLYSRRGDCRMFLADFKGSESDYEKMIEIDDDLFNQHWRLGIAYYYTGKLEKSAKQFEAYDRYNNRDRENGIWQFMARVKIDGLEEARPKMLKYEVFDREPFPQLYDMFEGEDKSNGDGILTEIRKADVPETERERRLFFANLYVGIYKELIGKQDEAIKILRGAAASKWGQTASGGPTYMWQVSRLHYERLLEQRRTARKAKAEADAKGEGLKSPTKSEPATE